MHPLKRRELLRIGAMLGASSALGASVPRLAFGGQAGPILVVVHLRGGCDGLNLISPANDPAFIAARAADLRVPDQGEDAGHPLGNDLSAEIDFRLHAAAPELAELYDGRGLAFVLAVGLTEANRSHFVATDMIERGVGKAPDLARVDTGWIARYLAATGRPAPIRAASAGNALTSDFDGDAGAVAVPTLDGGFTVPGGAEAAAVLSRLYEKPATLAARAGAHTLDAVHAIDSRVSRDGQGKAIPYKPEAGSAYERAGGFGVALRTVAQLIKMDLGLCVAGVEIGGWDTHEYQVGRFRACVEQLSRGIGSFWTDVAAYHDRVVIVGVTEFGRRLRSNRSGGTDHGRAGVMFVLGAHVAGGRLYGRWPGLDSHDLDEGVDLAVTTDYRAVLSEVLLQQVGAKSLGGVFGQFPTPNSLGLFSVA